jgi:DNA polymerase
LSSLSIDFETRSTVDLKKTGIYRYAEDPSTDIWCMAWAFDDEEPVIWTPPRHAPDCNGVCPVQHVPDNECGCLALYAGLPQRIVEHILIGGEVRAWNAQFERLIWREIMVKRYGAPEIQMEQFVCSAAEAAAMALPRYLAGAAHVLGVSQQKDDKGSRLMLQMAKPRRIEEDGTVIWWDVPAKKEILFAYCQQDVRTERAIIKALRRLPPREREVYLLDQRINDRGVRVDLELVRAASIIVDVGVTRANARLDDLTNGAVTAVTQNGRMLSWLNEADAEVTSISKAAVAALLERDDLSADVEEVLQLRVTAGRSSVAKLQSLQLASSLDHRARGLLLYHGASTGRWTGKTIQPQNFPRGEVSDVEDYIPLIHAGDYDIIDLIAPPIVVVLSMLRSMLTAAEGHELIAGDFSAIEARVLNWLAGQEDMLSLFRQYDAADKKDKPKFDPYRHNAAKLYNIPLDQVEKFPHRQTGKFQELGCGYGMGAKKAVSAAKTVYQLDITSGQAKEIVDSYRGTHQAVVNFWYETERACLDAVREPGTVQTFGGLKNLRATVRGGYLYILLPSGRPLCYAGPHIADRLTPWGEMKASLHFKGVDSFTKQWGVLGAYGGLLVENIVQAVSRDLMAEAMFRLENAGYLPVLSVHDEVVSEVPEGFGSVQEFERLMSELPAWATGCPVAAEGWRGFRYRK